jgi:branched-chain amino acid transport system ATP-binding protein
VTANTVPALQVHDAVLRFGGITALNEVSFAVEPGETFGIIGPNGAGKPALCRCSGTRSPAWRRIGSRPSG